MISHMFLFNDLAIGAVLFEGALGGAMQSGAAAALQNCSPFVFIRVHSCSFVVTSGLPSELQSIRVYSCPFTLPLVHPIMGPAHRLSLRDGIVVTSGLLRDWRRAHQSVLRRSPCSECRRGTLRSRPA